MGREPESKTRSIVMSQIILTPSMDASFGEFRSPTEVCNSQGNPVGFFWPLDGYKKMLATLKIPYTKDELERRKAEQGGQSLSGVWEAIEKA